ncbi:unnamed protein product, partial [Ectocarpus sp. 6 AP-2014]
MGGRLVCLTCFPWWAAPRWAAHVGVPMGNPWPAHGGHCRLARGRDHGRPVVGKNAAHGMPTMSCPWAVHGRLMGGRTIKTSKVWETLAEGRARVNMNKRK